MKLLLLSDLHLVWNSPIARLDEVRETQIEKLKFVLDRAREEDNILLQAGDFFDRPRSWYLTPVIMDLLKSYSDVKIYCVRGQHDKYLYSESTDSTSLGILEKAGLVQVLRRKPVIMDNIALYGSSFGEEIPTSDNDNKINILIIHAPILQTKVWQEQTGYHYAPAFLNVYNNFDLILCGDIHQKFSFVGRYGNRIVDVGPMLRLEGSVEMLKHKPSLAIYDTETKDLKWEIIPHKPADVVLSREHLENEKEKKMLLDNFIKSVREDTEMEGNSFMDVLNDLLEKADKEVKEIISKVMEELDVN